MKVVPLRELDIIFKLDIYFNLDSIIHTQYVANKYFDTVELKRPRASIILTKKNNCLQHIGAVGGRFLPSLGVILGGSHFGWAPHNFMVSYFVPPLCA